MARAKQRTPELRDHVLRVAVTMLAEEGVAAFTTRKVAQGAATSIPAVYELFGDKGGLVREVFFEGFRRLRGCFDTIEDTDDSHADLLRTFEAFRGFALENPVLTQVMFARPFADFAPGPEELASAASVRESIVGRVRRCTDARVLAGDPADISHILFALVQGLAAQESAGWLGTTQPSIDRRWSLALSTAIKGLAP